VQALRALGAGLVDGKPAADVYARALNTLRTHPRTALAALPAEDFDVLWPLGTVLRCALEGAGIAQATRMWDAFEWALRETPASPFAGAIAGALRARPAPEAQMRRLAGRLAEHPSCAVRSAALALDGSVEAAQTALRSTCWRLQSAALSILEQKGVAPREPGAVPAFQRDGPRRASPRAP
jgi:hypothetical protein